MSECFNKTIWSSQLRCQNILFGFSRHYWLKDMLVSSWHWCNLLKILSILRIEPLLSLPRRQIYQRPEIIFYYLRTGRGRWFKLGNSRFFQGKSHRLKGGKIQISSQSIKPNPRIRKLHNLKKKKSDAKIQVSPPHGQLISPQEELLREERQCSWFYKL